jgi:hypothetical protein
MAGSDEHLKPLRLFDLAWNGGSKITAEERKHLHECEDCENMLEVFARLFTKPSNPYPGDAA